MTAWRRRAGHGALSRRLCNRTLNDRCGGGGHAAACSRGEGCGCRLGGTWPGLGGGAGARRCRGRGRRFSRGRYHGRSLLRRRLRRWVFRWFGRHKRLQFGQGFLRLRGGGTGQQRDGGQSGHRRPPALARHRHTEDFQAACQTPQHHIVPDSDTHHQWGESRRF